MTMSAQPGNIAVLGSTGSIGRQTLDVVRANPGKFRPVVLAARSNINLLAEQAREFRPEYIAVADPEAAAALRSRLHDLDAQIESGPEAVVRAATYPTVHSIMAALVGFAGLRPVLAALEAGKHVALANKEALVAGGTLLRQQLVAGRAAVVPVDSEHSSLFQCLAARGAGPSLRRVAITASGGPFLHTPAAALHDVRPQDALRHPRWSMGVKNTIDSATLMNKGLEVIEAAVLFDLPPEQIEVLVHPQSLLHGFAEYEDGSVLAALFETDMRVPIAYALSYLRSDDPLRAPGAVPAASGAPFLDLIRHGKLEFFAPDTQRFPALRLCYKALAEGGAAPVVLNAANEIAVEAFVSEQVGFTAIAEIVARTMRRLQLKPPETTDDISSIDAQARDAASEVVEELSRDPVSAVVPRMV